MKIDWLEGAEGFYSEYESMGEDNMFYQYYYPKAGNIQPEQEFYIKSFMDQFENAVFSDDFYNNDNVRYTDYIDVTSFVDFLIINELLI